jgi:hypothetical protein
MVDRILTRHPQGKAGVNIERHKYEQVKDAIETALSANGELTFAELNREAEKLLKGSFEGKITWYVVTVKLDLEARGRVERLHNSKSQRLRLTV